MRSIGSHPTTDMRIPENTLSQGQLFHSEPVSVLHRLCRRVPAPETRPHGQGPLELDGGAARHPQPDEPEGRRVEVGCRHQGVQDSSGQRLARRIG